MFKVVKPFAYSVDGFTSIDLKVGDGRESFGTHNDGLLAEGYIEAVAAPSKSVELALDGAVDALEKVAEATATAAVETVPETVAENKKPVDKHRRARK